MDLNALHKFLLNNKHFENINWAYRLGINLFFLYTKYAEISYYFCTFAKIFELTGDKL